MQNEKNEKIQAGMLGDVKPIMPGVKKNILEIANDITSGARNKDYGHPAINLLNVADLWNAYLGIKARTATDKVTLTQQDITNLNLLQKIARLATNPSHADSIIDIAGYARVHEMIVERLRTPQSGNGNTPEHK